MIARLTKQLKVEEQVEESKEPEKAEPTSVEEEEPCRTEEDREVKDHLKIDFTHILKMWTQIVSVFCILRWKPYRRKSIDTVYL